MRFRRWFRATRRSDSLLVTVAKLEALQDPAWKAATEARIVDAILVRGGSSLSVRQMEKVAHEVVLSELDLVAIEVDQ